jgi:hypothetical protein
VANLAADPMLPSDSVSLEHNHSALDEPAATTGLSTDSATIVSTELIDNDNEVQGGNFIQVARCGTDWPGHCLLRCRASPAALGSPASIPQSRDMGPE